MPYLHNYRLFISHAWSYSDNYNRIVEFLNASTHFEWTNYSVPETKAFETNTNFSLSEKIKMQIRPVQCVIILAGMYVAHSEWIQFEIDVAKALNKPILGILPWGQERIPVAVANASNKMVGWNTATIIEGIREITP